MRLRKISCALAAGVLALVSVPAHAEVITAAWNGVVTAMYFGSYSWHNNVLGLLVNGKDQGINGLSTYDSQWGDQLDFGHVQAGDDLVWYIKTMQTGNYTYSSDWARWGMDGTVRGFDDNPRKPDGNFYDYVFTYWIAPTGDGSQTSAVPEPGVWAMLIAGFGGIGSLSRRRKHALKRATV